MVKSFREKPSDDENLTSLKLSRRLKKDWGTDKDYLASMGVYVFRAEVLQELLADDAFNDFGGDILPSAIHTHAVATYLFDDYWEDIGTIRSFFDANLALTDHDPKFRFYEPAQPIYTRARFLPPPSTARPRWTVRWSPRGACSTEPPSRIRSWAKRSWLQAGLHGRGDHPDGSGLLRGSRAA